jgi:hypothetical protein
MRILVPGRMPYRDLPGCDIHGMIRSTREVLTGESLETLQSEIRLPGYADLPMYEEWLPLKVAGVYRTLMEKSHFDLRPDVDAEP